MHQASFKKSITDIVSPTAPPIPATDVACNWSNKLAQLPDPTKGGAMIPGIVGQGFVFGKQGKDGTVAADIRGGLTLTVHDVTPRPPGMLPQLAEVWQFTNDSLKHMTVFDERFGKSLVLFLPWPDHWRDVNRVYIQARYDQPDADTCFAQPTTVTLDFTSRAGANAFATMPTVPDPALLLKRAREASSMQGPKNANPIQQTGGGFPPNAFQQPTNYPPQQASGWVSPPQSLAPPQGQPMMPNYGGPPATSYPQQSPQWPMAPQQGMLQMPAMPQNQQGMPQVPPVQQPQFFAPPAAAPDRLVIPQG